MTSLYLNRALLVAPRNAYRASAGLGMRLAVDDRILFGLVHGLPVGAAPGLVLLADCQRAAPFGLDRMHPALRAGAFFERQLVGFGGRFLVPAGTLFAAVLIVGDGAVPGIGRRRGRQRHDDCRYPREDLRRTSHRAILLCLSVAVAAAQDTFARGMFLADLERAELRRVAARTNIAAPRTPLLSSGKRRAATPRHRDHDLAVFRISRLQAP